MQTDGNDSSGHIVCHKLTDHGKAYSFKYSEIGKNVVTMIQLYNYYYNPCACMKSVIQ